MTPAKRRPSAIGDVLAGVLKSTGIAARVEQALVIPEWPQVVGEQIALISKPHSITADGTLFVHVTTNAWMMELSMLEPELVRGLNARAPKSNVKKIRWLLKRD